MIKFKQENIHVTTLRDYAINEIDGLFVLFTNIELINSREFTIKTSSYTDDDFMQGSSIYYFKTKEEAERFMKEDFLAVKKKEVGYG